MVNLFKINSKNGKHFKQGEIKCSKVPTIQRSPNQFYQCKLSFFRDSLPISKRVSDNANVSVSESATFFRAQSDTFIK